MGNLNLEVMNRNDIQKLGKKLIEPFDKSCLTTLGYDLRVGKEIFVFIRGKKEELSESNPIVIPPGARFAVKSLEKVKLTDDMFAFVFTKVGILWEGLTSLGTKIDPFFQDNLLLIFSNDSSAPFTLKYEQKICNVMFFKNTNSPKGTQLRGLPNLFPPSTNPPTISDVMNDEKIKEDFGYGIFSALQYLRPKISNHNIRLRRLEHFKRRLSYAAVVIFTTVVSGIIVWLLTGGKT